MTNHDEYIAARDELEAAQAGFDQADAEHIDIAVHRLQAAELRLGVAIRELRAG